MTNSIFLLIILLISIFYSLGFEHKCDNNTLFSRDDGIALRGLAAIFVLISHIYVYGDFQNIEANGFFFRIIGIALTQLGGLGVLLFLFLSGYGIQEGYRTREVGLKFVLNRIKKVYIPYLCIKVIFYIITIIWGIGSVLYPEDWFILIISIEYFLYFIARKLTQKNVFLVMLISNILLASFFIVMKFPAKYYNSVWLFVVGVAFSCYQQTIVSALNRHSAISTAASMLIFILCGVSFTMNKGELWSEFLKPVSGIALILLLCCMLRYFRINSPILLWCGKNSLELYIIHVSLHAFFKHLNSLGSIILYIILSVILVSIEKIAQRFINSVISQKAI